MHKLLGHLRTCSAQLSGSRPDDGLTMDYKNGASKSGMNTAVSRRLATRIPFIPDY